MRLFHSFILIIFILFLPSVFAWTDKENTVDIPFDLPDIQTPVFRADTLNIMDFGAVGNGIIKNTKSINNAIKMCSDKGGGTVIIPAGIWLTGPIKLQNNVNLHLENQALLKFSADFDDYPLIHNTWEGVPTVRCLAPISGFDLKNIAITGDGIINGSGDAWRPVKKFKMTDNQWKELIESGGVVDKTNKIWWPSEFAMNGGKLVSKLDQKDSVKIEEYRKAREYLRPVLLNFVRCKKILLDGPTFTNSPAWNIHPLLCEDMTIRNIYVRNPWYSQNGDGIDLESCKNVVIYNSQFDVGDDAMCIKSGKNEYGRKRGRPSENIIIKNCTVYHGHGGFTVGSEMSGGVRNIFVANCTFIGTDVGLRFKSTRGRGGIVENIHIANIYMMDIPKEAIRFNMFYDYSAPIPEDGSDGLTPYLERKEVPIDEGTPVFRNIKIKNIYCRSAEQAILVLGLPEMAISQVQFENVNISADKGLIAVDADNLKLKDVNLRIKSGPAFSFIQTRNLTLDDVPLTIGNGPQIIVNGSKSANIKVLLEDKTDCLNIISTGKDVLPDAVKCE
jgi:polygalacturonase